MLFADFAYTNYFQDPASPNMYGILELHDTVVFYLIIILF